MSGSHADNQRSDCRESLLPLVLLTSSSLLVGYYFGRGSYVKDVVQAARALERSPQVNEIRIPLPDVL